MGIKNFYKFIEKYSPNSIKKVKINDYSGKTLGVDANLILYRFLNRNIHFLYNKKDSNIENNYDMFYLQILDCVLLAYDYNIKLVFVFDGKTPDIKKDTVKQRKLKRSNAKKELDIFNKELEELENIDDFDEDSDMENINSLTNLTADEILNKKKKILLNSIHLNSSLIKSVQELLTCCGIPVINAPEEADSQLAYLSKNNIIDGIITNDFDNLTFGGKKIIMDFFGKNTFFRTINEINLEDLLKSLNLTYESFVELCTLFGSDYSESTEYNYDKAYDLIKSYSTCKNFPDNLKVSEKINIELIKNYFINPPNVEKNINLEFFVFNETKFFEFINPKINDIITKRYIDKFLGIIKRFVFFSNFKKR
jgi:flap endonuclease-1